MGAPCDRTVTNTVSILSVCHLYYVHGLYHSRSTLLAFSFAPWSSFPVLPAFADESRSAQWISRAPTTEHSVRWIQTTQQAEHPASSISMPLPACVIVRRPGTERRLKKQRSFPTDSEIGLARGLWQEGKTLRASVLIQIGPQPVEPPHSHSGRKDYKRFEQCWRFVFFFCWNSVASTSFAIYRMYLRLPTDKESNARQPATVTMAPPSQDSCHYIFGYGSYGDYVKLNSLPEGNRESVIYDNLEKPSRRWYRPDSYLWLDSRLTLS